MMKRILVPLDGSKTAEAILPHVYRILKRRDAEVVLLRAVSSILIPRVTPLVGAGPSLEAAECAAGEYLEGVQEEMTKRGIRARALVRLGGASLAILETAQAENASLIAMTTHGHSRLAHLLFGSVTDDVVRASPAPVLVIHPFSSHDLAHEIHPEDQPLRNILVPLDSSPQAFSALPLVAELARLFQAGVLLVRVLEDEQPGSAAAPAAAESSIQRAAARQQLSAAAQTFLGPHIPTRVHVEEGEVAQSLLSLCKSHDIDLVAMATHGRSAWSQFISGSVTEKMLRELKIPLLAVRGKDSGGKPFAPGEEYIGTLPVMSGIMPA